MRREIVLIIAGLVMVSTLAGCGKVKQGGNNQNINQVIGQEKEGNISKDKIGYEIIKKVAENKENNSKIFYPQISGYKGQLLMDYMNQSLKKIVDMYGKKETYKDVNIDYKVTKMDRDIISVLFNGTGKLSMGKEITIEQSVNLDIKSSNEIVFNNFIKNDQTSKDKIMEILNQKAKAMGIMHGIETEGIRVYFEGENAVFYYMPADDSATRFVEISVPTKELESYLNTDFGEKPAS